MARSILALALLLLAAGIARATAVGDTLQQVLAEKGPPKNQIEAGPTRILTYPDVVIKLRDGRVVSVKAAATPASPRTAPVATPTPVRQVPASVQIDTARNRLDEAVARVRAIVNQPVPPLQRPPNKRVWTYMFHEGATRPDFNSVDVRATQETHYDEHDYISWEGHPDLMWVGTDLEFNSMLKYFYEDRTVPKKKLTEAEMVEINRLYRVIGQCEQQLAQLGYSGQVP